MIEIVFGLDSIFVVNYDPAANFLRILKFRGPESYILIDVNNSLSSKSDWLRLELADLITSLIPLTKFLNLNPKPNGSNPYNFSFCNETTFYFQTP